MLKTLLASLLTAILATTAMAQASHPYIKPDLDAPKQLAPLPLADPDKASQPAKAMFSEGTDKAFWVLAGAYVAGSAADIITTKQAINRGGVESNQLFARNDGKDIAIGLNIAVSLIPLGLAYLLQKLGAKWPARVLLGAAGAIRWNAAIHNHNLLRD